MGASEYYEVGTGILSILALVLMLPTVLLGICGFQVPGMGVSGRRVLKRSIWRFQTFTLILGSLVSLILWFWGLGLFLGLLMTPISLYLFATVKWEQHERRKYLMKP